MKIFPLFLGVLLLSLAVVAQDAPEVPAADERVKAALDELKLKYEVGDAGRYVLVMPVGPGRKQTVYVNSAVAKLGQQELREIWSIGFLGKPKVPEAVLRRLLEENAVLLYGSWQLQQSGEREVAVIGVKLPAEAGEQALFLAIRALSSLADAAEEELTQADVL